MAGSVFPIRGAVDGADTDPTVVSFDDAESVFDAMASETARNVVAAVQEAPGPPSEIAERADISLQNAIYHLDRLAECGVLEIVDTWYSSRGVEMDVYAIATDSLVVELGDERDGRGPIPSGDDDGSDLALAETD